MPEEQCGERGGEKQAKIPGPRKKGNRNSSEKQAKVHTRASCLS